MNLEVGTIIEPVLHIRKQYWRTKVQGHKAKSVAAEF